MQETLLMFLGVLALIVGGGTLVMSAVAPLRSDVAYAADTLGGFAAAMLWWLFAYGSTSIVKWTETDGRVVTSEPALLWIGIVFGALFGAYGLYAAIHLVDVRDLETGV